MERVILESPFAGDVETNVRYARLCLRDSLNRGEAPYASHLLYTQPEVLNDDNAEERDWGINAGFQWRAAAHKTVVYTDLGISRGMEFGSGLPTAIFACLRLMSCLPFQLPWRR